MKTITVKDNTWQKLTNLKVKLMSSDIDSAIQYLLTKEVMENDDNKDERSWV